MRMLRYGNDQYLIEGPQTERGHPQDSRCSEHYTDKVRERRQAAMVRYKDTGHRSRGRQRKSCIDAVNEDLKTLQW